MSPALSKLSESRELKQNAIGKSEGLLRLMQFEFYYFLLINAKKLVEDQEIVRVVRQNCKYPHNLVLEIDGESITVQGRPTTLERVHWRSRWYTI